MTPLDSPTASRDFALQHLEAILPSLGRSYASTRNYDLGPGQHKNVSGVSPWVRHRLVLEEELVSAALGAHGFVAPEKFIQEVFWRTYWKGWLELRPDVWHQYKRSLAEDLERLSRDDALAARYDMATAAKTGIDCFDAWSTELQQTNYLHNHARMWFASIWIFTLRLPWALGADLFMRHLMDGDPASNTLSWRWVAGLQTVGKHYLARADNIAKFTQGRFDPSGLLNETASALVGPEHPRPRTFEPQPPPKSDAPTILLVTDDDLALHNLNTDSHDIIGVAGVSTADHRSPGTVSATVRVFADQALSEAVAAFTNNRNVASRTFEADNPEAIIDWAVTLGASSVLAPYAPVGPGAEFLDQVQQTADRCGKRFERLVRPWDATCWPKATQGFFRFKQAIPSIIAQLDLPRPVPFSCTEKA